MKLDWREWRRAGIEAALVLLVMYFFLWPVTIDGISMEDTLNHADKVMICRTAVLLSAYQKGDVVVFQETTDEGNMQIIKRIIAVEGDSVRIADGQVYVNGIPLAEPYRKGTTYSREDEILRITGVNGEAMASMTVPPDSVFVMGDNREHSADSRMMGAIPKEKLVGVALFRWFPSIKSLHRE